MSSPWIVNTRHPTAYRMQLAQMFSQEGRRIFGDRWKGLYVIGSTASGMASHLKDVDVVPLIEGIRKGDAYNWDALRKAVDDFDRRTAVFIEVWLGQETIYSVDACQTFRLEQLRAVGPERMISSEAVLLAADVSLDLPVTIERPEIRGRYVSIVEKGIIRGETTEAQLARIHYEKGQRKRRKEFLRLLSEILPTLGVGPRQFEQMLAAFAIIETFIHYPHNIYNRFEFLVTHEAGIKEFLGCVPNKETMNGWLLYLTHATECDDGDKLKAKIRNLNAHLVEHGFQEVLSFLLRNQDGCAQ